MRRVVFPMVVRRVAALLLLCVLAASVPAVRAAPPAAPALDPALIGRLEDGLNMAVGSSPGVILAVHIPGYGDWSNARGFANRADATLMEAGNQFRVASLTKMFVATVVLQLVQEGHLALDAPLSNWYPGLVPDAERITVRQLLAHTSGLYDYMDGPFMRQVEANPARVYRPHDMVAYAAQRKPYFAPGAPGRWQYSNTNYVILGMLVEKATGDSLANQIRSRILKPLDLAHTYSDPDEQVPGTLAHGYLGRRDLTDTNMSFAWGAGNIVSTADDLAVFLAAMLDGRLLCPESLAEMQQFRAVGRGWGANLTYGLGLMHNKLALHVDAPPDAGVVLGHTGWLMGYRTSLWYLPASGITIAAMMNQESAEPNKAVIRAIDALASYDRALVSRR